MPMTALEAAEAIEKLRQEIGPRAYVGVCLSVAWGDARGPLAASIYPQDMTLDCACRGFGFDWDELIASANSVWAAYKAEHSEKRLKEMALAIIRLTGQYGKCSDAALRMEFDAAEVASLGARACIEADRLAANGPFSITADASANAA